MILDEYRPLNKNDRHTYMFMSPMPQQHNARRVARLVRAVPAGGSNVAIKRIIGDEGLPHFDPFLNFDELSTGQPRDVARGFPDQPHRGFASLTYITKGRMRYSDTSGRDTVVEAGQAQWLVSGRGCVHSEMPELVDGAVQGFKLWLNLPASEKMQAPAYNLITASDIPAIIFQDAEIRVLAGRYHGIIGPVTSAATEPFITEIILKSEGEITLPIAEDHAGFVYVFEGSVAIGQTLIARGQAGFLTTDAESGNVLNLVAGQAGARLLVVTAKPLNEPIVRHGPFVMTSHQDIKQAFIDYQNGLF